MGVDVACLGETMVLLVPDPPSDPDSASLFRRELGGAESNVAITLSRLGARSSWHSALGDDAFGRFIASRIEDEGVDCRVRYDSSRPTGLYVKEIRESGTTVRYYRGGSAASRLTRADAGSIAAQQPRLIHTTGITPALSAENADAVAHLWQTASPEAVKSFDVNFRPAIHHEDAPDALRRLANSSDIVFCGADEAQTLWDTVSTDDVRGVISSPSVLVVKHGAEGATVFSPEGRHFVAAEEVDVVEVVGAGDALAAGYLYGRLQGLSPKDCLQTGTQLAARAVQVTGDLPEVEPHCLDGQD